MDSDAKNSGSAVDVNHDGNHTMKSARDYNDAPQPRQIFCTLRHVAMAIAGATTLSGCGYLFPVPLDATQLGIDLPTAARYVCNDEHLPAKRAEYVASTTQLTDYAGTIYTVYCGGKIWKGEVKVANSDSSIAARERAGGYEEYIEARADAICSDHERADLPSGSDSYFAVDSGGSNSFTCIFGAHRARRLIAADNDGD